jgi:SAM-dependent methyltransferase
MKSPESTTLALNPFSDDYWEAEISNLGLKRSPFHVDHLQVVWFQIKGRCDDYLNLNMRFSDVWLPRLAINGHLWMSLTPMEIQSAALAIHRSTGHVVTCGLGLGYFALRAAGKPEVTKVTVFENEPLVIEWFNRAYKGRPELAKIVIVEGDARNTFKGFECDFAFVDIYKDMLPDEVLADAKLFRRKNKIARYHYWGYEKVILELLLNKMLKYGTLLLGTDLASYFRLWRDTPYSKDDDETTLGMMYRPRLDRDYLKQAKRLMSEFPI